MTVRTISPLCRRMIEDMTVRGARCRPPALLRRSRTARRRTRLRRLSRPLTQDRVGRLRQAPFAGPVAVLAYLARYTHRVAIANSRLISLDDSGVTFTYKDYRRKGHERYKTMTLAAHEFIRRFLIHVLPKRFHRIRHYGLFANGNRVANIARARELLDVMPPAGTPEGEPAEDADEPRASAQPRPGCGGRMIVIEVFEAGRQPRHRPTPEAIDSS